MTYRELYECGKVQLQQASVDDAENDAWYLLEYVTGRNRTWYFLNMTNEVCKEEQERYQELIEVRKNHIPLQHITGEQEFMGLSFLVNEHVLIPRQDTEILVEWVLKVLQPGMTVLDMCTGSGCILVSLAKFVDGILVTGADISKQALEVAKYNAQVHNVDATFVQSDLFEMIEMKYDVIVSNPPYIRTDVIEGLKEEVKLHDPYIALDGKEDGLYFYRKIVDESVKFLNPGGKLYFEVGHDQGCEVKELMEAQGFKEVAVKKDLAGLDRVVFGVYNV